VAHRPPPGCAAIGVSAHLASWSRCERPPPARWKNFWMTSGTCIAPPSAPSAEEDLRDVLLAGELGDSLGDVATLQRTTVAPGFPRNERSPRGCACCRHLVARHPRTRHRSRHRRRGAMRPPRAIRYCAAGFELMHTAIRSRTGTFESTCSWHDAPPALIHYLRDCRNASPEEQSGSRGERSFPAHVRCVQRINTPRACVSSALRASGPPSRFRRALTTQSGTDSRTWTPVMRSTVGVRLSTCWTFKFESTSILASSISITSGNVWDACCPRYWCARVRHQHDSSLRAKMASTSISSKIVPAVFQLLREQSPVAKIAR